MVAVNPGGGLVWQVANGMSMQHSRPTRANAGAIQSMPACARSGASGCWRSPCPASNPPSLAAPAIDWILCCRIFGTHTASLATLAGRASLRWSPRMGRTKRDRATWLIDPGDRRSYRHVHGQPDREWWMRDHTRHNLVLLDGIGPEVIGNFEQVRDSSWRTGHSDRVFAFQQFRDRVHRAPPLLRPSPREPSEHLPPSLPAAHRIDCARIEP